MATKADGQVDRDLLRRDCWENALHAFGTSHIFQRRARRLKNRLHLLNYAGVALPLIIGAVVLSFGVDLPLLSPLIAVVALFLIAQLAVSLWAAMGAWVERYAYAVESAAVNDRLARGHEELAKNPPSGMQFKVQYDLLGADDKNQRDRDIRQHISEKELRRGMRAALHRFQRVCASCGEQPKSLKSTACDTCGNF